MPRLLVSFSEAFPGIEIDLHEGTAGDMRRYLADDRVDAAFSLLAGDPPADVEVERLSEEEVVAAFPPAPVRIASASAPPSSAVTRSSPRARVLPSSRPWTNSSRDAEQPLRVALESGDPFLLRCLVSTGFGAAVLPASLTRREGPPIDVRGLRPAVRLPATLLWRKRRHQSPRHARSSTSPSPGHQPEGSPPGCSKKRNSLSREFRELRGRD